MIPSIVAGQGVSGQIPIDANSGNAIVAAPGTGGATGTQVTGGSNLIGQYPATLVSSDGNKATYQYSYSALAPAATPTAFCIIAGSATKTVRIKRIRVSGVATSTGNMQIQLARWSTAGSVGAAVTIAVNPVKHDVWDPSATATVNVITTSNYTTQGTGSTTPFLCDRIYMPAVATGNYANPCEFNFATRSDKALILRGTTDIIAISGNSSALPAGGVIDIQIETEEDNS